MRRIKEKVDRRSVLKAVEQDRKRAEKEGLVGLGEPHQIVSEQTDLMVQETVDEMKTSLDTILPDGVGGKLTLQHGPFAISFPLGDTIAGIAKAIGFKGRNVTTKGKVKFGLDIS